MILLGLTVDLGKFGKILSQAGAELQSGKRKLVQCTDNPGYYLWLIYGDWLEEYGISDKVNKKIWQNLVKEKKDKKQNELKQPPSADPKNFKTI